MPYSHKSSIDANEFQRGDRVIVRDSQGDMLIRGEVLRANDRQVCVKYMDRGRWTTSYYYPRYVEREQQ